MISTAGWQVQGVPVRYRCRNNFQRKDFVRYQWSKTRERRIHHPPTGANSGADHLLSGFSGLGNSAHKGDDRDGGSLRFLNPCCDQVLFAVAVPTALDRTIQQEISQPISDIYERIFSDYSYGFRPGRSCHDAIKQALEYLNEGYEWVVDIDIEQFFDKVNHDKLIQILREQVNDSTTLNLIRKYLKAGVMENGLEKATITGVPQGGPLYG